MDEELTNGPKYRRLSNEAGVRKMSRFASLDIEQTRRIGTWTVWSVYDHETHIQQMR